MQSFVQQSLWPWWKGRLGFKFVHILATVQNESSYLENTLVFLKSEWFLPVGFHICNKMSDAFNKKETEVSPHSISCVFFLINDKRLFSI